MKKFTTLFYLFPSICIPIFYYLIRFLVPDHSFDSINYHIYLGEVGIKNLLKPFGKGEFFPLGLHSFTSFYELSGALLRNILGYRLGTLPSILFYVGIIFILFKIIKLIEPKYFEKFTIIRFFLFINISIIFELLFQVGTYFVDIINTFFLLLSVYYLLSFCKKPFINYLILFSFIFGLSIYGKWTNLMFVPAFISAVCWKIVKTNFSTLKKVTYISLIGFITTFPLLINSLYLFNTTGSPLFPFYNAIFKSKYYVLNNFTNSSFGPKNLLEGIIWPAYSLFHPARLGEIENIFFDMKLSAYWVIGILLLITILKKKKSWFEMYITFLFYTCYFGWSITFGYLRYATIIDCLGGILLIMLYIKVKKEKGIVVKNLLYFILFVLCIQNYYILKVNLKNDYSWRLSLYNDPKLYSTQLKYIFNNSLHFSESINKQIQNSDIFLNCAIPNSGYYVGLKSSKPMIFIKSEAKKFGMSENYFSKVASEVNKVTGNKEMLKYALITFEKGWNPNHQLCMNNLKNENITIDSQLSFFDYYGYPVKGYITFGKYSFK